MFDLSLSDELELIAKTTEHFAAAELAPRIRESEQARGVTPETARRYAETGLATLELSEALSGGGLGALARALVNEELGAADPGAALALDALGPALYAIAEAGGESAVREHLLPLLAKPGSRAVLVGSGDAKLAFADGRVPAPPRFASLRQARRPARARPCAVPAAARTAARWRWSARR